MKHPAGLFARGATIVLLFAGTNDVCWGQTEGGLARSHFVAPNGDALWGESVDRDKPENWVKGCVVRNCTFDGGLSENLLIRVHFQGEKAPYYTNYTSIPAWQASGALVGGKNPGQGSLDCDPRFVNRSGKFESLADFRLVEDSPCRGAGRDGEDMGADVGRVGVRGR